MRKPLVVALVASIVAVLGCGKGPPSGPSGIPNPPFKGSVSQDAYRFDGTPGTYGGSLVLGIPDDIKTFNIVVASDNATADVLWLNVFRCLVDYRNAGEKPGYDSGLSTKWEASPDAMQWTFHLRRGVSWSDGQPFTADDVLFTYAVSLDERVASATRDIFLEGPADNGAPMFPSIEKIDDYTVRFNLNKPNGSFLDAIYNLWLIPRHKFEGAWKAGQFRDAMTLTSDFSQFATLGPYVVKEYVSGQRIVLERNPYYWKVDSRGQRLPYLDQIVFVIAKDFNTLQAKFEVGDVDILSRVRPQDYAVVKRLEGPEVSVEDIGVSYDTYWLAFNLNTGKSAGGRPHVTPWKLKLFSDQRFRQAVSYAIDRPGLANTVFSARAVPVYSFVTPGDPIWYSDNIMKYDFDPDRARQLLKEIGLKDSDGNGVLEDSEGHQVEITVNTNSSNSQRVESLAFVARNLRDVGIKVNSEPMALGIIADKMEKNFSFDAILLGWQVNPPPGPTSTKNILLSSAAQHVCFPLQDRPSTPWEAEIDRLMHEIESKPDLADRTRMYAEVQRIWSEQLPEINLIAPREAIAYRNKFGNLYPAALPPRVVWNSDEIYLTQ
jgi:peptide/nickel transport system substrate-binding protein